ncbi:MAG: transcription initiation factor IIB, partial [Promethearchaeota archaeon]
ISLTTTINRNEIKNPDLKRATKWDTRITWQKRNLLIATTELKRISSNLNVPDYIMKEAMRLYKIAFSRKLLRGRSINGMVAACLYYALLKEKIPITFQEILDESAENEKDIKRCYSVLVKELKLKLPSRDPSNLIPRFASKLGVSAEIEQLAVKITREFIKRFGISGKDPRGIVAAVLYLAGKIKQVELTQNEIATLIGITEVTLRSRCKEIKKKLNITV